MKYEQKIVIVYFLINEYIVVKWYYFERCFLINVTLLSKMEYNDANVFTRLN